MQRALLAGGRKSTQYDIMNVDTQAGIEEKDAKGKWIELQSSPTRGGVLRVKTGFSSGDEAQVDLASGAVGIVEQVDNDGDALVRFPTMTAYRNRARWVL